MYFIKWLTHLSIDLAGFVRPSATLRYKNGTLLLRIRLTSRPFFAPAWNTPAGSGITALLLIQLHWNVCSSLFPMFSFLILFWLRPFFVVSPAAGCCVCPLSLCFAIFSLLPSSLLFLFFSSSSFLPSTCILWNSLPQAVACPGCLILFYPSRSVLGRLLLLSLRLCSIFFRFSFSPRSI